MAQEPADHRAVLLLNPSLIVLPVRQGTGELDATFGAVIGQGVVDEHAAVVGVDATNGKGQLRRDGLQSATTRDCSLASSGTASVQPVHTSVPPGCTRMNRPCCPHSGPPGQSPGNPAAAGSSRRRCEPEYVGRDPDCAAVCAGWTPWTSLVSATGPEWRHWRSTDAISPRGPDPGGRVAPWSPGDGAAPPSGVCRRCGRTLPRSGPPPPGPRRHRCADPGVR